MWVWLNICCGIRRFEKRISVMCNRCDAWCWEGWVLYDRCGSMMRDVLAWQAAIISSVNMWSNARSISEEVFHKRWTFYNFVAAKRLFISLVRWSSMSIHRCNRIWEFFGLSWIWKRKLWKESVIKGRSMWFAVHRTRWVPAPRDLMNLIHCAKDSKTGYSDRWVGEES